MGPESEHKRTFLASPHDVRDGTDPLDSVKISRTLGRALSQPHSDADRFPDAGDVRLLWFRKLGTDVPAQTGYRTAPFSRLFLAHRADRTRRSADCLVYRRPIGAQVDDLCPRAIHCRLWIGICSLEIGADDRVERR